MNLTNSLIFAATCIISYLLGSFSVARTLTKKRIKTEGSGNPGTMNMLRTHGMIMGVFTLFTDALKGAIPALFGLLYFGAEVSGSFGYTCVYIFGLCATLGHIFPIYYKFKGGKGIATTFGMFVIADPITSVILFGILFITLYLIRIGSVVSLLFVTINAIVQIFRPSTADGWIPLVAMFMVVVIDIYAHRENLGRLIENKENPADLEESLKKDIDRIQNKRIKRLEKNMVKTEKIENKFDKKIEKKSEKVQSKISKITQSK